MQFRDKMIGESVRGKSFADIGPLWETVNEKISIAHHFGASSLMAIDQFDHSDPLWAAFHKRMAQGQVYGYNILSGNVLDYDGPAFDVVHCGGVIYHAPDPIHLLKKLRAITKERLVLVSTVTPKEISNSKGKLTIPDGAMVFVPALSQENKDILAEHWNVFLGGRADSGLVKNQNWHVSSYHNWWWLFTPEVLNAMCVSCGFTINNSNREGDLYCLSLT